MTDDWNIGINLSDIEMDKLKEIIDDLFESNAVNSSDIQDFLRFTLFIVFDESKNNKESLRKFYRANLKKFNSYKIKE
ncbi:MAG TPA: hypothetical protein VFY50_02330 [Candidatus Nitrosocosmicus sp.]|nr:hypothetical protein [Candidatus Nitrosocosmicus sp.]